MNEKYDDDKIYTRFYLENLTPKARRPNKRTRSGTHKNKKVIIRDDPGQYPDGAVTMDKDCDCG